MEGNFTSFNWTGNNFFSGYVNNDNIYTYNGDLIGVNLKKYKEIEDALIACKNRLIELGEIKPQKTPEEIIKEQSEMLDKQTLVMQQMAETCQKLQEQLNNGFGKNNQFPTAECEEQSANCLTTGTQNDRSNEDKNTARCNASVSKSKK